MQGFFSQYLSLRKLIINKLNEILAVYDLSYPQWLIMYYLKNTGSASLILIAEYYHLKKPVVTRTVQMLEERKLVQQIPSRDKRQKIIRLTDLGETVYATCRQHISELERRVFEDIPQDDVQTMNQVILRMKQKLDNKGGNA